MLKGTKDSSAAYGVLAIFLLLLSASQGVPVAEVEENVTTEVPTRIPAAVNNSDITSVRELNSSYGIRDPCSFNSGGAPLEERHKPQYCNDLFWNLNRSAWDHRAKAQQLLDEDILRDCSSFHMGKLPNTTSLEELLALNVSDALETMFASILRHAAYAYFIHDQHEAYAYKLCSKEISNETSVKLRSGQLGQRLKNLACKVATGASAMDYPTDYSEVIEQVLDDKLSNLELCSRRFNRDCQVFKSIIYLLDVVSAYSNDSRTKGQCPTSPPSTS